MKYVLSTKYKKILITGGSGFIGSNFILRLLKDRNLLIYNLDKISYASDNKFLDKFKSNKHFNYIFLKLDLNNQIDTRDAVLNIEPDLIVNFAAESHVDRSIINPRQFLESNTIGTFNLLEASRDYWEKLSNSRKERFKFLHVSTDEVFGAINQGKFSENSPYRPSNPYSASKAASDHFVNAWYKTFGFPSIVSNCSNNYGPRQFHEKLIPMSIYKILNKSKIPVYGNGENIRDWLYVDDHIDALIKILFNGISGTQYCIGANQEISNLNLIKLLCSKLDIILKRKEHSEELISFVDDRLGHDYRYSIDSSFIKKSIKWMPKTNLDLGLDKTINWYLKNKDWTNIN